MKNQKHTFNAMLLSYNRYVRKLKRLTANGLNFRKQEILEKRIAKMFEKLSSINLSLKRTTAVASLIGCAMLSQPNNAFAQNFNPRILNPYGLSPNGEFDNTSVRNIEFVDIDGDGDEDLFAAVDDTYPVTDGYFIENIGTQTNPQFGEPVLNPSWIQPDGFPTEFADIDGDGDFDLFYKKNLSENIGTATEPNFAPFQINPFANNSNFSSIKFADLDNDGDLDLVSLFYGYYDRTLSFYENTGSATAANFNSTPFLTTDFYIDSFTFGDIDNDGDLDIMSITNLFFDYIIYFENSGTSNVPLFNTNGEVLAFNLPENINDGSLEDQEFADLNNDGNLDLFISGLFGINYFENNGEETCPTPTGLSTTIKPNGYKLAWQPVEGSTKCEISGGKVGGYQASYTKYGNEPSSVFLNFNRLKPNKDYYWRVRCNCAENNDFGAFSYPTFFSTGSFPNMNSAKSENENIFGVESNIATKSTNVKLFPNPANGSFVINTDLENYNFELTDVTGKLVYNQNNINQTSFNFDIKNIEAGTYFVTVNSANASEVVKLMVD
jgi:Secretion system C-terminal sorting domain/FG-GAP-like repeat